MKIIRFYLKAHVYMAEFTVNNCIHTSAVWSQAGQYYVSTGNKMDGTLARHDFDAGQTAQYNKFVADLKGDNHENS